LGAGSQAVATLVCDWAGPALGFGHGMSLAPVSVLANGFGMFLIMLVIRDTDARALSEQSRLDLERVKTLQVAADLAALRARIRPHFLFNTLTALASLCNSDPAQAERSILKLSRLLRRTLAAETTALTNLEAEVEYLQAYVDIQTLRFGDGIRVKFALEPSIMSTVLPAFTLQTLVENSYQHGFAMRSGSGEIQVIGRKFRQSTLLAVWDSGVGMDSGARSDAIEKADLPRHGMGIIDKQLQLLFGPRARLRVFSRKGKGTLIAFQVPRPLPSEVHRTA
jgi:LytS/YehU family sensor histidine kinase